MIQFCRQGFKNSYWKKYDIQYLRSILLNEGPLIDSLINDVPQQCLDNDVAPRLGIAYLSKCEWDENKINSKLEYKGAMIGSLRRLFISVPVSHPQINKFVNIHFLVDTVSPFSTLTHKALCAIHQRPYSTELIFPRQQYNIGGIPVHIHLSNPNPSGVFHNVNLLGMDFLTKFKEFLIKVKTGSQQFDLKLLP